MEKRFRLIQLKNLHRCHRAKIIGLLTAAASKIVRTVKEPSARVARVIAAKS